MLGVVELGGYEMGLTFTGVIFLVVMAAMMIYDNHAPYRRKRCEGCGMDEYRCECKNYRTLPRERPTEK